MIFCWEQEIPNEILHIARFFKEFNEEFIVSPLVRLKDKPDYEEALSKLSKISDNITVVPIYLKSPNSNFSNILNPAILLTDFLSISKVIKKTKPNVIVCFYLSHAYPLSLLKFFGNFSLCTVAMGSDVYLDNSFLQKTARQYVYRSSDLVFARSWKLKEAIQEEYAGQVIVNPSSTDTSFFKPLDEKAMIRAKYNIDLSDRVLITVCRLDKNKGVDILLNALRKIDLDNCKLLIVGDGVERKALEALSSSLNLKNKVIFMGSRSKSELLELYNLADVFVLASYSEGLPRVLLEAMACQCIPIVTNVGSINAVVTNSYNGFIIDSGQVDDLTDKIKKAFSLSKEQLASVQTSARQTIVNRFDSREIWKQMICILTESATKKD
jgi:GalNAc-alpha-(1->4)-GalNAc-alpha-(1->3)-diNAcBac-PP-undecaprenol alpha-1,4-N-acetyl-D-galactosaminyltransferase